MLPLFPPDMSEPRAIEITDTKVHATVPSLIGGDTQDDKVKQSLTLSMIAERYPQEAWINAFTDGLATNAEVNIGTRTLVHFQGGEKTTSSITIAKHCSGYHAETEALMHAASILKASDRDCKQVLFFCLTPLSCKHIKTTSSLIWPQPFSKLQIPGWQFYSGFQPTVEYQEMSKQTSL